MSDIAVSRHWGGATSELMLANFLRTSILALTANDAQIYAYHPELRNVTDMADISV